jgi:hypothetical protein
MVWRAELTRPLLDWYDGERESGMEDLPVQEQARGAPVAIRHPILLRALE